MSVHPITILPPKGALSPLVVDSPHSGCTYPADFSYICPLPLLRQTEDFKVDELVQGACEAGATVIAAEFPRSYIDVNRGENDIDPAVLDDGWDMPLELTERTLLGLGLVRRLCMTGVPVYAAPLSRHEIKRRIENCYRPYYAALETALSERLNLFGRCYLLNCHSMPSRSQEASGEVRPDFILGDRRGTSCDLSLTRMVADWLQDKGYSVALNDPYKGMEIIRRHGWPEQGRHALQIEINRRLYMDERKWELHEGAVTLQNNLTQLFKALAENLAHDVALPLAAE